MADPHWILGDPPTHIYKQKHLSEAMLGQAKVIIVDHIKL